MVSWSVLRQQDDFATAAALKVLDGSCKDCFSQLAATETQDILDRDNKDAEALKAGIKFAQSKGVLPVQTSPPEYCQVDVLGKNADTVSSEIMTKIGENNLEKGCVMVLVGLSGTGKGTTVGKMKESIEKKGGAGKATAWSNGNLFRCLTYLACEMVEKTKGGAVTDVMEFPKEIGKADEENKILTSENLDGWVKKHLRFEKRADTGKWDIELTKIDGTTKLWVSEICNTLLKEPRISKSIPLVAAKTQGEVVLFASDACQKMGADGTVVLVEGREDTVNFIPTEHRFCLTISDTQLIGKRRAAQRVVALALEEKCEDDGEIESKLEGCLKKIKG